MIRLFWVGIILTTFFSTCEKKDINQGEVIASVYGKNLYKTDLESISYKGISFNDSIMRSRAFIDKWIRTQLLLHQAQNNLNMEEQDFSKEMEDYRNSLIINTYETKLISQNLKTEVTDEEIFRYYENNDGNFRLNRNIVKYISVNLDKDSKERRLFTKLMRDYDSLLIDSITSLAEIYAVSYNTNANNWCDLDEVIALYDLKVDNQETFLNENKFLILNKDTETVLIRFCDYRMIGEETPCELETERIKYIILSTRKKNLLDKLYDDLYSKALRDKAFEIH